MLGLLAGRLRAHTINTNGETHSALSRPADFSAEASSDLRWTSPDLSFRLLYKHPKTMPANMTAAVAPNTVTGKPCPDHDTPPASTVKKKFKAIPPTNIAIARIVRSSIAPPASAPAARKYEQHYPCSTGQRTKYYAPCNNPSAPAHENDGTATGA